MSVIKRNVSIWDGSLEKAIADYRKWCERRYEKLPRVFARHLCDHIAANSTGVVLDDLTEKSGGPITGSLAAPKLQKTADAYVITVNDVNAVWVEFGAGVYHNGAVGQSPNPLVDKNGLPFRIGTFGKGNGRKMAWDIGANPNQADDGVRTIMSHGTPAAMPIYNAVQQTIAELPQIIDEVFGKND